jgi:hypothetical protein
VLSSGQTTNPQSALVLLLLQELKPQATKLLDQARQWFGYIAGTAEILGSQQCQSLPADMSWLVLRPVLRLLLWLVPEHAPAPSNTPAAAQTESVHTDSANQGHVEHSTASTPISEDWRCSLVLAYIRDIATVSGRKQLVCHACQHQAWLLCGRLQLNCLCVLLQPVHLKALLMSPERRMAGFDPSAPLRADAEGFRFKEECLFWVELWSRYVVTSHCRGQVALAPVPCIVATGKLTIMSARRAAGQDLLSACLQGLQPGSAAGGL